MASTSYVSVEFSPNWRTVERALKYLVTPIMRDEQLKLAAEAAEEAQKTAQEFLDHYVYDAPLPPSADETWGGPEHYLERSRTGRTRAAVKTEKVEKMGVETASRMYVDRTDYEAYFYALALNYGMLDKFETYYPRPFFTDTIRVMRELYGKEGELTAMRVTARVRSKFA